MISSFESSLSQLSIHKAGNKLLYESLTLAEHCLKIEDDTLEFLLKQYFLSPFERINEIYRLFHPTDDITLNEVNHFADQIFNSPKTFHKNSQQLAKHLYDISNHPKIKAGEVYFAYFDNLQIEGELLNAIGIFKSESKESYLKVLQQGKDFQLNYEEEAINIKKLDKGCLIFNTEKEKGFKVAVIDQTNQSEAIYWKDNFLKVKLRDDTHSFTNNFLKLTKQFITSTLPQEQEISKTDQVDFLNKSVNYFKENETLDINDFQATVFQDKELIKSFQHFGSKYSDENNIDIADKFEISDQAVKKQARAFKRVLKLDKNFDIYIHGNKELIEKGYDAKKGKNFYKIYFDEEE